MPKADADSGRKPDALADRIERVAHTAFILAGFVAWLFLLYRTIFEPLD